MRRRVLLESPYAGDVARNVAYARKALLHSLTLGEAPFAGHLLYTQVLDDASPLDREIGISAHVEWVGAVDAVVVYEDNGVSRGMLEAISAAHKHGVPVEYREIAQWLATGSLL